MKKTIVKAAAVQISPVLYSRQGPVEKVVKKIRELGKQGVQFATFPETIVPYYPYFSYVLAPFALAKEHLRLLEESVTVPSSETRAIGEAAKEANMVVSIGVNERDGGSIYNTQLLFDADGTLIQRRRKLTPTYNERILWGQGDGSGLRAIDSAVGRIGQLACFEHNNPLARYAMIADGEQIHSAMYPGSFAGPLFAEQAEINVRQHALESACFVVCATAWLDADQQAQIMKDTGCAIEPISGGCFTAIVSPDGQIIGEPLKVGEGEVIADLDFAQIDARKRLMDARGHYSHPELLSLLIGRPPHPSMSAPHTPSLMSCARSLMRREPSRFSNATVPIGTQLQEGQHMSKKINYNRRYFLTTMLTTIAATQLGMIGCTTQHTMSATAELPIEGKLPSLVGAIAWLNSQPLTVDGLRGKVVLINFWTYTCINWLRQLPYVCSRT